MRQRARMSAGEDRPKGTARDRAMRLLAVRWRSRSELRSRLRGAGFPEEEIEDALAGLERAGLVDDARFARLVVKDQSDRRHASDRAIRATLRQKGIGNDIAEEALGDAPEDEDRARTLAESRAPRLAGLDPGAAYRRLYGLLLRRGHSPSVARDACRAALRTVFGGVDEGDPGP